MPTSPRHGRGGAGNGRPKGRVPGLVRRIAASFQPYWPRVLAVGLLIVITAGLGVVNPVLIRVMFDSALFVDGGPDLNLVWTLAAVMAGVVVLTGSLGVGQTWLTQQVGQQVMARFARSAVFAFAVSVAGFLHLHQNRRDQSRVANGRCRYQGCGYRHRQQHSGQRSHHYQHAGGDAGFVVGADAGGRLASRPYSRYSATWLASDGVLCRRWFRNPPPK